MIVHFDDDLVVNHTVTTYSPAYVEQLRRLGDQNHVQLAETWPQDEVRIERDEEGAVRAFHAPEGGLRREVAQVSYEPTVDHPVVPAANLETARAALLAQIDAWYGAQVTLRFPLAALHAAKLSAEDEHLGAEAAERGVEVEELRAAMQRRDAEQTSEIMRLDAERRELKKRVSAASAVSELEELRRSFVGA